MKVSTRENQVTTESQGIQKFISAISSKNYAAANKYLKSVIELKLKTRINNQLDTPLF
jgi:hypothetical protein